MLARRPYGDGVITGHGLVHGRRVFAFSQDFTVFGGSLGEVFAEKVCKVMDMALRYGCPIVGINDSGGARIQEGVVSLAGYADIFQRNVDASGVIPQISLIMGPCAGGAVYSPAITDFILMVRGTSHMFITGPDVVKTVTGEEVSFDELGGADTHATRSGVAHLVADDEAGCIADARALLSFLPDNNLEPVPYQRTDDPPDRERAGARHAHPRPAEQAVRHGRRRRADRRRRRASSRCTPAGPPTSCAASRGSAATPSASSATSRAPSPACSTSSRPRRPPASSAPATRSACPIVTFVDVPGFLPGTSQEWGGIIRHGAKLLYAYAEATVPKLTVITRKAYGGAYDVMGSKHLRADLNVAWPTAEVAVMGPEGAVNIVFRKELAEAEDPVARRAELVEDYKARFANPYTAAERGYVDDVIVPRTTPQGAGQRAGGRAHQARRAPAPQAREHPAVRDLEVEIEPEAAPEEVAAVTAAVTELAAEERLGQPAAYRSAWRRAAARELVDGSLLRAMTRAAVRQGARREPRRDRDPRLPRLPRARRRHRRGVLRRRPRRAARARRRRGVPARAGRARRELPARRARARGRRSGRRRRHPPGLRLPGRERAASPAPAPRPGSCWIGPPPEAMEAMGSKIGARRIMDAAGVPIVPGTTERVTEAARVVELGEEYGWPIALKASAGGGGKGLKVVTGPDEAERALESAQREGQAYFADPAVYVEKYVQDPRHVEIQVIADAHGTVVWLGERDCTLQRRHQKIVEETPSPAVDAELRARMGLMAVDAARAVGYVNAGTIECLLDREGRFYFLEMNTRIQVEHTITEAVTGIDLVREQLLVAAGRPLSFGQDDVEVRGHAIECRINAEDPAAGFLPSPGRITRYREPSGPGIRVDAAMEEGGDIVPLYDPMVGKLVVWDRDRDAARARMRRALDEYVVEGVHTLIPLHRLIMEAPEFARGETCAGLVEDVWPRQLAADESGPAAPADGDASFTRRYTAEVDGRRLDVTVHVPVDAAALRGAAPPGGAAARRRARGGRRARDVADAGHGAEGRGRGGRRGRGRAAVLAVVEAMKMENEILAPRAGVVAGVAVAPGQPVQAGQAICDIEEDGA